MYHEKVILGHG